MKNDAVLSSLINFLVPIIFLYALFCLVNFIETGFFAIIYSAVLLVSGFMIYLVRFPGIKYHSIISFELAIFSLTLLLLSYLIALFLSLTDLGQI